MGVLVWNTDVLFKWIFAFIQTENLILTAVWVFPFPILTWCRHRCRLQKATSYFASLLHPKIHHSHIARDSIRGYDTKHRGVAGARTSESDGVGAGWRWRFHPAIWAALVNPPQVTRLHSELKLQLRLPPPPTFSKCPQAGQPSSVTHAAVHHMPTFVFPQNRPVY